MENDKLVDLMSRISMNRDERAFSKLFDFLAPKINAYYLKNNLGFEQSEELTQELTSHFGLDLHQTSGDSEITIKEVFCLGNCALGPSVMINDSVLGEASKDKVIKFLEKTEK